jgi:hypothetical protein
LAQILSILKKYRDYRNKTERVLGTRLPLLNLMGGLQQQGRKEILHAEKRR